MEGYIEKCVDVYFISRVGNMTHLSGIILRSLSADLNIITNNILIVYWYLYFHEYICMSIIIVLLLLIVEDLDIKSKRGWS